MHFNQISIFALIFQILSSFPKVTKTGEQLHPEKDEGKEDVEGKTEEEKDEEEGGQECSKEKEEERKTIGWLWILFLLTKFAFPYSKFCSNILIVVIILLVDLTVVSTTNWTIANSRKSTRKIPTHKKPSRITPSRNAKKAARKTYTPTSAHQTSKSKSESTLSNQQGGKKSKGGSISCVSRKQKLAKEMLLSAKKKKKLRSKQQNVSKSKKKEQYSSDSAYTDDDDNVMAPKVKFILCLVNLFFLSTSNWLKNWPNKKSSLGLTPDSCRKGKEMEDRCYILSQEYPELAIYLDEYYKDPTNTLANYTKNANKALIKNFKRNVDYHYPWSKRKETVVGVCKFICINLYSFFLFLYTKWDYTNRKYKIWLY
mgnify:CR=1 FL=1